MPQISCNIVQVKLYTPTPRDTGTPLYLENNNYMIYKEFLS
jgi:hypothetical protein